MKKIWAIIPAAVLAIGAGTAGVLASANSAGKPSIEVNYMSAISKDNDAEKLSTSTVSSQAGARNYFVDSNNDGFCDNYIDGVCWQDGSGCGYHHGNGNYVDNNNDGFCDNYIDGVCWQDGSGCGYHHGNGNYVDNNNYGVCDNYIDGVCPQNGSGSGHHRGNGCHHGRTGV